MAYVPVPKDLTKVKTKVMFNLTKRQLICFTGGALIGVPLFLLLRKPTGNSVAAMCMMLVMLPFFMLAMYEKHGQPLEKIVGILCEGVSYGYQQQGRGILCGIGINLAQPQSYFDAAGLPNGTSLALQGAKVDLSTDPAWLAEGLTDFGFDRNMYVFARDGFAPFREEYKAACVNLGRRVTFDLPDGGQGAGEAVDVDEEGRLVVRTDSGEVHVFTGEVSVHGIYGAV